MSFEAGYLHTFWNVCREGGFGRAARALHRTQPAVSYQVRRLEETLATRLLTRAAGGVRPTAAGAAVLDFCERFFSEWRALEAGLGRAAPEPLRIASVSGFGRYVLYPRLLDRAGDGGRVELSFPTADEVFARVEDARVDVGFSYTTRAAARLAFQPVWMEELVLITARRDRRRGPPPLERATFVTYDEHEYVFGRWFDACLGRPPARLAGGHHFEELEEVVDAVARGHGLSIVPDFCVAGRRDVDVVRPTRRRCKNRVYAVLRAGRETPPRVAALLARLAVRGR
jgi:DNA-binding transcriptional LysR family regulator